MSDMNAQMSFTASTGQAEAAIGRLQGKLDGLSGAGEKASGGFIRGLSTALAGVGVAAAAGFAYLSYKVKGASEDLAIVSATARDCKTSVLELRTMNYVASQFGVSAGEMAGALGAIKDQFPEQNSVEVFNMLREQMAGIADPAERAAYAEGMLGDKAKALYPLLMANNEEYKRYVSQVENAKIGDSLQIEKVEEAKQAMDRLGNAWDMASNSFYEGISVKVAPLITWLAEKLESFFSDTSIGSEIVAKAWDGFNFVLNLTVDAVQILGVVWYAVQSAITKGVAIIVDGLYYLVLGLDSIMEAVTGEASNMAESFDSVSQSLHKLAGEQWDNVKKKATAPWWSEQMQKELKEIENRPVKKKFSFEADNAGNTDPNEVDPRLAAGAKASGPAALLKNSTEAIQLVAKFRNGELVDKKANDQKKLSEKQLAMQQQIRDKIAEQKPPVEVNF